ncbi:MAG: HepT-like ribonuclease domain-containing protein [Acidimicrobiia bacterium]
MLDAVDRIGRYCEKGPESLDDEKTRDAVFRCLTVIGEALGALSEPNHRRLPSLPPRLPKGQRNILVHEYWRIDLGIIWDTIQRDLPPLKKDIQSLLAE